MKKEQPIMTKYQESYIELVAKKTGDAIEGRISVKIEKLDQDIKELSGRIIKVERKIFNGFGMKINLLFVFYAVFIGILVKLAFFH